VFGILKIKIREMKEKSHEVKALELLQIFGDDELALKCVNELVITTGAKYWYKVQAYIEEIKVFRQTKK
jgi:orotidine-5'-phosphate decarboxylase